MTLVVSVQCSEGIVIAADSASTMVYADTPNWVWTHAKKVSHVRDYNIGTLSFGAGALGSRNIQSLIYEFENTNLAKPQILVDEAGRPYTPYKIDDVVAELHKFLCDKHKELVPEGDRNNAVLGMIVAGYDHNSFVPKQYHFQIPPLTTEPFNHKDHLINFSRNGFVFLGMPDAVYRLLYGYDNDVLQILSTISFTEEQKTQIKDILSKARLASRNFAHPSDEDLKALDIALSDNEKPKTRISAWNSVIAYDMYLDGMPLQDGIDLAIWLIETTIGRYRFANRWSQVGGEIDIAVITHSDFTWIRRKAWHAYRREPEYFGDRRNK